MKSVYTFVLKRTAACIGLACGALAPVYADPFAVTLSEQVGAISARHYENLLQMDPQFQQDEADVFESMTGDRRAPSESKIERQYRVVKFGSERNSISLPLYRQQESIDDKTSNRFDAWGVKWQHRLDADQSISVAAHRGDTQNEGENGITTGSSTMASVSWMKQSVGHSSFSGSVFVGDEISENALQPSARRYYGFTVGGRFHVYDRHTPYLSLKLQKSDYENAVSGVNYTDGMDKDYFSRISAGWDWNIQRNWSIKAEANYTMNNGELDWGYEQSRIFFGTRYDFR